MTSTHISALLLTLALYVCLAFSFCGWGKATSSVVGQKRTETGLITYQVWVGWATTLLLFQLIHLVLPLTASVAIPVFALGIAMAIPGVSLRPVRQLGPLTFRRILILSGIFGVVLGLFLWIPSRSMLPPANWDSGLYHFNTISWLNSYPVVPGLGNLHGRLAFNQSFFAYVSALNFHPYFGHGPSVANSFLFLLTLGTFVETLAPVFRQPSLLLSTHPFRYLSVLFALPILAYLGISSQDLASPSPDLTVSLMQITMFIVLAQGVGEWLDGRRYQGGSTGLDGGLGLDGETDGDVGGSRDGKVVLLGILAVTAVTAKLSGLAFSLVVFGFVFFSRKRLRTSPIVFRVMTFSALVVLVWTLHGVVLSGSLLYPSPIGHLPLDWAVPKEKAFEESYWVMSYARDPWQQSSETVGWFEVWLPRMFQKRTDLAFPVVFSTLLLMATAGLGLVRKGHRLRPLEWAMVLPSTIGLVYWFLAAPDIRFAHAAFFVTGLAACLIFLASVRDIGRQQTRILMICGLFAVANLHFAGWAFANRWTLNEISMSGWQPPEQVPLVEMVTASGLVVYTPETGEQCWDSPLPCTPYFNVDMELRDTEKISSGFKGKGDKRY